jgi:hypothetical protein
MRTAGVSSKQKSIDFSSNARGASLQSNESLKFVVVRRGSAGAEMTIEIISAALRKM